MFKPPLNPSPSSHLPPVDSRLARPRLPKLPNSEVTTRCRLLENRKAVVVRLSSRRNVTPTEPREHDPLLNIARPNRANTTHGEHSFNTLAARLTLRTVRSAARYEVKPVTLASPASVKKSKSSRRRTARTSRVTFDSAGESESEPNSESALARKVRGRNARYATCCVSGRSPARSTVRSLDRLVPRPTAVYIGETPNAKPRREQCS